ncbi:Imm26 family immunity protein [Agromyces sp. H66]|uniref:Imm26 family immunity protein n=1 Tax=Agromyces sp. H66 TaxID=2529859 RepID=UPI0024A7985C|nr:Imm26 family immunity protein [Agromyces sp. H66]
MRVLQPSRRAPRPGDVFVFQLPDESFRIGMVVRTDARWTRAAGAKPAVLIYIFDYAAASPDDIPKDALRPDRLLVRPILTNRLPWTRGYFRNVENISGDEVELLPMHCFSDEAVTGAFFDEMSNRISKPVGPVGEYGLQSFRTIDDIVSDAVGIPRAAAD